MNKVLLNKLCILLCSASIVSGAVLQLNIFLVSFAVLVFLFSAVYFELSHQVDLYEEIENDE